MVLGGGGGSERPIVKYCVLVSQEKKPTLNDLGLLGRLATYGAVEGKIHVKLLMFHFCDFY